MGTVGASLLLVALGSYVRVFWALSASLVLAGAGAARRLAEVEHGVTRAG